MTASTRSISSWSPKYLGDLAQRFGGRLGADEVDLDPGDAVFHLQHVGHVVDRAVAHDAAQIGLVGGGELVVGRVAGKGGDIGDPALLEDPVDLETVAADVVFAQQVDLVLVGLFRLRLADQMGEDLVVGDMVTGRLRDALVALAAEGKDVAVAELFLHLLGHGMDIVADQADRAGGEDGDGLRMKEVVGLLDGRRQFLLAAEDDVGILHVGGHAVGDEIFVLFAEAPVWLRRVSQA